MMQNVPQSFSFLILNIVPWKKYHNLPIPYPSLFDMHLLLQCSHIYGDFRYYFMLPAFPDTVWGVLSLADSIRFFTESFIGAFWHYQAGSLPVCGLH